MNWLDIVILLTLVFFAYLGIRNGFLIGLLELVGIIVSLIIPFILYLPLGNLLVDLGISKIYSGAIAFLIIWFITLNLYFWGARRIYRRIPTEVRMSMVNRLLGIIPGLVRGLILIAVILAVLTVLPTPIVSQQTIDDSLFAPSLVDSTVILTTYASDIFGEAAQNAFGFLTIKPESSERVDLQFRVQNPIIDAAAESEMLRLINQARTDHGLRPVVVDEKIREVARQHSIDMFRRGYFAHVNLEGRTPFERMRAGGVRFLAAGENLALAPTVRIAHSGLMKSPGHRENILRPQFRRVGIGAARGGRYGIMFTQNFAD